MKNSSEQFLTTKELLACPPVPMLIDGLVPRQGVTGISGDPGSGKTFVALEMARTVLNGGLFLDRFKTKRGSVLFVGQDCSTAQYAQQVRKVWTNELPDSTAGHHIRWLFHAGVDLKSPKFIADLIAKTKRIPNVAYDPDEIIDYIYSETWNEEYKQYDIEWQPIYAPEFGVAMIILDTWINLHTADENSNTEMAVVMKHVRLLADATDAAIVLLHHHPHPSEHTQRRWRGARAQEGMLDSWLEIAGSGRSTKRKLKVRKFRGIPTTDFNFEMATTEETCKFTFAGEIERKEKDDGEDGTVRLTIDEEIGQFLGTLDDGARFTTREVAQFLAQVRDVSEDSAQQTASRRLKGRNGVTPLGKGIWQYDTQLPDKTS